ERKNRQRKRREHDASEHADTQDHTPPTGRQDLALEPYGAAGKKRRISGSQVIRLAMRDQQESQDHQKNPAKDPIRRPRGRVKEPQASERDRERKGMHV